MQLAPEVLIFALFLSQNPKNDMINRPGQTDVRTILTHTHIHYNNIIHRPCQTCEPLLALPHNQRRLQHNNNKYYSNNEINSNSYNNKIKLMINDYFHDLPTNPTPCSSALHSLLRPSASTAHSAHTPICPPRWPAPHCAQAPAGVRGGDSDGRGAEALFCFGCGPAP